MIAESLEKNEAPGCLLRTERQHLRARFQWGFRNHDPIPLLVRPDLSDHLIARFDSKLRPRGGAPCHDGAPIAGAPNHIGARLNLAYGVRFLPDVRDPRIVVPMQKPNDDSQQKSREQQKNPHNQGFARPQQE